MLWLALLSVVDQFGRHLVSRHNFQRRLKCSYYQWSLLGLSAVKGLRTVHTIWKETTEQVIASFLTHREQRLGKGSVHLRLPALHIVVIAFSSRLPTHKDLLELQLLRLQDYLMGHLAPIISLLTKTKWNGWRCLPNDLPPPQIHR